MKHKTLATTIAFNVALLAGCQTEKTPCLVFPDAENEQETAIYVGRHKAQACLVANLLLNNDDNDTSTTGNTDNTDTTDNTGGTGGDEDETDETDTPTTPGDETGNEDNNDSSVEVTVLQDACKVVRITYTDSSKTTMSLRETFHVFAVNPGISGAVTTENFTTGKIKVKPLTPPVRNYVASTGLDVAACLSR